MKKKKIFEGKTKKVYEAENEQDLLLEFKDDACSQAGAKNAPLKGKGHLNQQIAALLFRLLESYHISTHYLRDVSDRELLAKKLDMIPVMVMVRNVAAGTLVKQYRLQEGKELECPIIEYYLKDAERDDPMINEDHLVSFGHATSGEIREIHRLASKINAILKAFLRRRDFQLVDLRLEFGRFQSRIVLADELSLNTMRLIDLRQPKLGIIDGDAAALAEHLAEIRSRLLSA